MPVPVRTTHRHRSVRKATLALLVACPALLMGCLSAFAQFGDGAVIVTVPSNNSTEPSKPGKPAAPSAKPQGAGKARTTAKARRARSPAPKRSSATRAAPGGDKLKIAILVNDDPITEYEISQQANLLAGSAGLGKQAQANFQALVKRKSTNESLKAILQETVQANQGRSREQILAIFEKRKKAFAVSLQRQAVAMARSRVLPGLRQKAIQELIDERLKYQAAKQAKVLVSDREVDRVMTNIAKRNKLSPAQFKSQLQRQGGDYNVMRNRMRSQMSWMRLVNAKFGRLIDINQKTIDEKAADSSGAAKVSFQLHSFVFKLPAKISQSVIAKRMLSAERFRAQFQGCASSRQQAAADNEVIFQNLGYRVAEALPEPTRTMLLNAADGTMIPPTTTNDGVVLYAVCSRREGAKSLEARAAIERELREKGSEIHGRKYLSDLRREAHIEYRTR